MQRLLLVDGHSDLYRAHYAIGQSLTAPDGTPTGATFGFLRILHRLLRELEPSHVGVAFDVGRETFRTELDERYKAQRKPMPDELRIQIPLVREALERMSIPIIELEGFEADDILGTLAARAAQRSIEVIIATQDKDMLQLVQDPSIRLWHTRLDRLLDERGAKEVFGVPPRGVPHVLALEGDTSDNVPGCRGIGKKGARELIRRWSSVPALYDNLDEVEPTRARNALEAHRDEVALSLELVTIRTDVDVPLDLDALRAGGGDTAGLAELYRRLGFDSLLAELDLEEPADTSVPSELVEIGQLSQAGPGAVSVSELAAAVAGGSRVVVARGEPAAIADALAGSLDGRWAVHGSHALLHTLLNADRSWAAAPFDTELAAYLVNPGEPMDLDAVARRHLTVLPPRPEGTEAPLACRALWTQHLRAVLEPVLEAEGLRRLLDDLESPLVPVLVGMERRGIRLDADVLDDLGRRLTASLRDVEQRIYAEAGRPFNINSPQQLAEIMFDRLDYPVIRRTAKTRRPSTNVTVLQELAARGYPLPALILEYREQSKLKSTYVDALPRQADDDGRIRCTFHQTVTSTGRLSSAEPNLQNIPIRTELGREVRRAFVAEPGCALLAADYSQIELRVLAHMSGDETLREAFGRGDDIHRATASAVFGVASDDVSAEQRRAAKTVNFGLVYGMGAYSLARDLGTSPEEAQSFIDTYFARFPGVKTYMDDLRRRARTDGKVTTLLGRQRRIADIDHGNHNVRAAAERMAINAPIQGTAADIIKLAMLEVDRRLRGSDVHLLLQVHDELIFEVPSCRLEAASVEVRSAMEGVIDLAVPLVVDVGWGPSWYEAK